jgi:hypothetical protein
VSITRRTVEEKERARSGDDSDIVSMGHQICADRTAGRTPDQIAQDIHTTLGGKGITFADVTSMVSAAESTYCPG